MTSTPQPAASRFGAEVYTWFMKEGGRAHANQLNHVHYKDWNGSPEFCLMGKGKVDFVAITRWLRDRDYAGWIICEDEGAEAVDDPDGVTLMDGEWVRTQLLPSL